MRRIIFSLALCAIILSACGLGQPSTLPTPQITTSSAPDAELAVRAYLDAWNAGDYPSMYTMLTAESRAAITEEDFAGCFANVAGLPLCHVLRNWRLWGLPLAMDDLPHACQRHLNYDCPVSQPILDWEL